MLAEERTDVHKTPEQLNKHLEKLQAKKGKLELKLASAPLVAVKDGPEGKKTTIRPRAETTKSLRKIRKKMVRSKALLKAAAG